jgi:hypothetical protein
VAALLLLFSTPTLSSIELERAAALRSEVPSPQFAAACLDGSWPGALDLALAVRSMAFFQVKDDLSHFNVLPGLVSGLHKAGSGDAVLLRLEARGVLRAPSCTDCRMAGWSSLLHPEKF